MLVDVKTNKCVCVCEKKFTIVIITVVKVIVTSFHRSPPGRAVDQRMEGRNKV